MRAATGLVAALLCAGLAGPALAEEPVGAQPQWQLGAAFAGEAQQIGQLQVGGLGLHLQASWRAGPVALFGEYSVMRTLLNEPSGELIRAGAGARIVPRSFAPDGSGRIELYVDGGLGAQLFRWDSGGQLRRPDLSFGGGFQVRGWWGRGPDRRPQQILVRLGLRMTLARAYDADMVDRVVCRGTCPPQQPPRTWDEGFLATYLEVAWGR